MATLIGQSLGKYQVVDRIGQGGMGEVYKAFQPGVERHVAIKTLHTHLINSADAVARFLREARAIGRLQHANIVRIIDVDVADAVYYMVMDYVPGGALSSYLQSKGCLPVDEALRIGIQLADALAYAHRQNMIHRDIKPTNILFTDGTHSRVVLVDFGLARLCDDTAMGMTVSGALIGAPTYMSPEAVRGESCDARADIYSLGVVLYELFTGKPPCIANTPYSMMMKLANEPLPSPSDLNPALPPQVTDLLLKALAKAPEARYQTASEFAQALRQTQATLHRPTPSSRPNPTPAAERQPEAPPAGWLTLGMAASVVVLVAFLTIQVLLRL